MRSNCIFLLLLILLAGCRAGTRARSASDAELFGPASMRIHPVFTQIKDWTADGKPDGIEALIEISDQFGDVTKATGTVMFELFLYRRDFPDPRGARVGGPWTMSLQTLDEQKQHWKRIGGAYSFQLPMDKIGRRQSYVLTAMFQLTGGGRYFDQIVLEPQLKDASPGAPATAPANDKS